MSALCDCSQHQVATTGKLGSSESIVAKGLKYKEVPPNSCGCYRYFCATDMICVCVYMYKYIYTHTYIHTYIIQLHNYIPACIHTYTQGRACTLAYLLAHISPCACRCLGHGCASKAVNSVITCLLVLSGLKNTLWQLLVPYSPPQAQYHGEIAWARHVERLVLPKAWKPEGRKISRKHQL